jgi:hypothetical protein
MQISNKLFSLVCTFALLNGCAIRQGNVSDMNEEQESADYQSRAVATNSSMRRSGAEPITHDLLENFDLLKMLDPLGKVEAMYNEKRPVKKFNTLSDSSRYDIVFAQFGETHGYVQSHKLRRNLIQNRLIVASDRRCGRFFQYMKKDNSDMNFGFGVASSALSTLGALVPGLQAAQAFSGLGALVSGVRAEYNNEYYSNLAVSVITKGIEEKRNTLRGQIKTSQAAGYERYDIAAAIADAVIYDASCNIVYGLEQANEAIQRLNDPSRDAMTRALLKDKLNRALTAGDNTDVTKFKELLDTLGLSLAPVMQSLASGNGMMQAGNKNDDVLDLSGITATTAAAATGQTLIKINSTLDAHEKSLKDYSKKLLTEKKKSSTEDELKKELKNLNDAINTSIKKIKSEFATNYAQLDSVNSCFAEAEALTLDYSKLTAKLEWATATEANKQFAMDAIKDKKIEIQEYLSKLIRYELVVADFANDEAAKFMAVTEKDSSNLLETWNKNKEAYLWSNLSKVIGTKRLCNKPGAKK